MEDMELCKDFICKIEKNSQYCTSKKGDLKKKKKGDFRLRIKDAPKPLLAAPPPRYPVNRSILTKSSEPVGRRD